MEERNESGHQTRLNRTYFNPILCWRGQEGEREGMWAGRECGTEEKGERMREGWVYRWIASASQSWVRRGHVSAILKLLMSADQEWLRNIVNFVCVKVAVFFSKTRCERWTGRQQTRIIFSVKENASQRLVKVQHWGERIHEKNWFVCLTMRIKMEQWAEKTRKKN